jgi:hypothetical protein
VSETDEIPPSMTPHSERCDHICLKTADHDGPHFYGYVHPAPRCVCGGPLHDGPHLLRRTDAMEGVVAAARDVAEPPPAGMEGPLSAALRRLDDALATLDALEDEAGHESPESERMTR